MEMTQPQLISAELLGRYLECLPAHGWHVPFTVGSARAIELTSAGQIELELECTDSAAAPYAQLRMVVDPLAGGVVKAALAVPAFSNNGGAGEAEGDYLHRTILARFPEARQFWNRSFEGPQMIELARQVLERVRASGSEPALPARPAI